MENRFKLLSGLLAFFVYFVLLGLILNYFNYHTKNRSVHYSQMSSKAITVSLSPSLDKTNKAEKKSKPKKKSKSKLKPKEISKIKKSAKKKKIKSVSRKPAKVSKKSEDKKPKKKIRVNKLFDKVAEKKPIEKPEKKSAKKSTKERKSQNKGIKDAYKEKMQRILYSWPAQSEFAGHSAEVWLKIYQDGSFVFKILSASSNEDFNRGLIQYLEQLQSIGFDPHRNAKPYEVNVEFIAKE